ncbi:MAG: sigma-70 family RNA polymerase sigma factor [Acidobacteria bacterium]|nr:sigma-70 family RNA polymerase sigma factor [Acidobacteriota bacterium]
MNSVPITEDFESVALPHLGYLLRIARRAIGNVAEAEDVVQETFLQAWKSFHRFQPGTNCRAWLFKILFHVLSHHQRRWFRMRQPTPHDEEMMKRRVAEQPAPEQLRDEDVLAAFAKLPKHYRGVVLLAYVQGFSYKEVAEIAGIPIGTVMSRLSRGKQLLRIDLAGLAARYRRRRTRTL